MDKKKYYYRVWRVLQCVARRPFEWIFHFEHDRVRLEGPVMVISNHVTNYDPLFVALSFPWNHLHFVASEHLFRKGWMSWAINKLVAPIARRKGSSGADASMACLRALKGGSSVALFAEGETTWDGVSQQAFPATGKLIKASGAGLVTYRLEGGYLTAPRWGKGIRRGGMKGHVVQIYTPEQLKAMSVKEVSEAIDRDIYEDAWERQRTEPRRYRSRRAAEGIEVAAYLCPRCRRIGSAYGKGRHVRCDCGLDLTLTDDGTFAPAEPFANLRRWDLWQREQLKQGNFEHDAVLASDPNMTLVRIGKDHNEEPVVTGMLKATETGLQIGENAFDYAQITMMALVQSRNLLFTHQGVYYELHADMPRSLRKYLFFWEDRK